MKILYETVFHSILGVVMLDTPCYEVVWRVLATLSIRQFPLHFPTRALSCAITFQMESTNIDPQTVLPLSSSLYCVVYTNYMHQNSVYKTEIQAIESFREQARSELFQLQEHYHNPEYNKPKNN